MFAGCDAIIFAVPTPTTVKTLPFTLTTAELSDAYEMADAAGVDDGVTVELAAVSVTGL